MRTNIYKTEIMNVLKKAHLLSIAAIHAKIAKADFSTIFRNVEQLCKEGLLRKVTISKDVVLYERAETTHRHDHFICNDCGTIASVQLPKNIGLKGKGLVHDVLIRGICTKCIA